MRCVGRCRLTLRLNEDYVSGEFQMHLKRLSKDWLAGVLLLATPVFAGTILPGHGSGSPGRTDWNVPAPSQTTIDTSNVSACWGVGQPTSLIGRPSSDGERLLFAADYGGFFSSTIFPGWGFTDPQNQDPPAPGTGGNYFLPTGAPLDLGQPADAEESAPEPATLWMMAAGLIVAGLFGRKLARQPVACREQDSTR
jgi:hypothetical protein